MMNQVRRSGALLALAFAAGCAAAPHPPIASQPLAEAEPAAASATAEAPAAPSPAEAALPPSMRELGLSAAQVDAVLRVYADLESTAEPFVGAANELGRSIAGAARQCKGETPFIRMDAARVIREGEAMRAPLLDAIQQVHRLLTPAQRKKLSDRLVEGDDWAKRERRNSSRTRDLGPALDLSTMQVMSMLVKAGVLWSNYADRTDPWRVHYRAAITRFARDDFDAHGEPVGAAPLVPLTLEFVQAGLRQLVPLLEPKQCEVLGHLIEEKLDDQAARTAERIAGRARVLERR
jgi:hypothetical protein